MNKKTFCPFINGDCIKECMFFTTGSSSDPDNTLRNCIIAKTMIDFPDSERQEKALESILTVLKHHP